MTIFFTSVTRCGAYTSKKSSTRPNCSSIENVEKPFYTVTTETHVLCVDNRWISFPSYSPLFNRYNQLFVLYSYTFFHGVVFVVFVFFVCTVILPVIIGFLFFRGLF